MATLANGATNTTNEQKLRQYLSPALKGKGWDALLAGFANGIDFLEYITQLAFDQLFTSTASGIYLNRKASDNGVVRPQIVGLTDEKFRELVISITANKTTTQAIEKILEIFYGIDSTKANITSTSYEPYALSNNDTLLIKVDNNDIVTVIFESDDFTSIGAATANEVCSVINQEFYKIGINAIALPFYDSNNDKTYVKLYSATSGLAGRISIHGGQVQDKLIFPTLIATTQANTTQWTITLSSNKTKFEWTGGTDPSLYLVNSGDYVNIYSILFDSLNRGTFEIDEVVVSLATQYFTVTNNGKAEVVVQNSASNIKFYTPTVSTIQNSTDNRASFVSNNGNGIDVVLQATSPIVERNSGTASYLHDNTSLNVSSFSRAASGIVTVNTSTNHGMSVGDYVFIDGIYSTAIAPSWSWSSDASSPSCTTGVASVKLSDTKVLFCGGDDGVTPIVDSYIYDSELGTWTAIADLNVARMDHKAILLDSGKVLVCGGLDTVFNELDSCELYDVDTNTWTYTTSMNQVRSSFLSVRLLDGKIFVCGGSASSVPDVFDPTTYTWTAKTAPTGTYYKCCGGLLGDGRVLMATGDTSTKSEVYSPYTDSWQTTSNAIAGGHRKDARCLVLPWSTSGVAVVTGGGASLKKTDFLDVSTLKWSAGPDMNTGRTNHDMVLTSNGSIMAVSGGTNTSEIYDTIHNSWTTTSSTSASATANCNLLGNGNILAWLGLQAHSYIYNQSTAITQSGGLNGVFKVLTIPLTDRLTYQSEVYDETAIGTGGTATLCSPVSDNINGPWIFDPITGVSVTNIYSTLNMDIIANRKYRILTIDANSNTFPDDGYLVLGFGTDYQMGPIKYSQRLSDTELLLDADFTPEYSIISGSSCTAGTPSAGGSVTLGTHSYKITFITTNGESDPTYKSNTITVSGLNKTVPLTNIPVGPSDCTARKIYRSKAGDAGVWYYLTTISNNTTTSTNDTTSDSGLGDEVITINATARYVSQNTPYDPSTLSGGLYITASSSGQVSASDLIDKSVASGLNVEKTIVYPGDRGLGGEGYPSEGTKTSDKTYVWGE